MKTYKRILVSDYELTEIYEDENLGLFREGLTTIDFLDVYRCTECIYKLNGEDLKGTKLVLGDNTEVIVKEKYKDMETLRRALKAEVIEAQKLIQKNESS